MRTRWLLLGVICLLATTASALTLPQEAPAFVSMVLDEGTEIVRKDPLNVLVLPWTPEQQAHSTEWEIATAWENLVDRIAQDWVASVLGCWFCVPGGWPVLNLPCIEAAREAVQARVQSLYAPAYWVQVETSLRRLPSLWARSPHPGQGAVIACVAGESSPPYQSLLTDPYYHQPPRPPYASRQSSAEPPGDPVKEAAKEALLSGWPARIDGYQRIGYVVFFRAKGDIVARIFAAPITGVCVQCVVFWCWPVVRTWTVTLQVLLPRVTTDWPAVAEGYGIPGLR